MKKITRIFAIAASVASFASFGGSCPTQTAVSVGGANTISADSAKVLRQLPPGFFSFNLEWLEFQLSLWDSSKNSVRPDVISWLSAFPGAIYRYPGGTNSNSFIWSDAVGPVAQRPARKFASWKDPFKIQFGIDEYLQFVQTVKGQAWYVANAYGNLAGVTPPMDLALNAGQVSSYMEQKRKEGKPSILRWELGNELDRNPYYQLPTELAANELNINTPIKQNSPSAKTATLTQEDCIRWGIDKLCQTAYNKSVVTNLKGQVDDYVIHLYYGDKYLSVPGAVTATCEAIDNVVAAKPGTNPTFWVTEHARIPRNFWDASGNESQWKVMWSETADLAAAIGVTDFFIASTQIPQLQAAFVHALHGTSGPWPLFHEESNGGMHPSAVYWGMRILQDSMLTDVLATTTTSTNQSANENGYDIRSVTLADAPRQNFSVWAVNRNGTAITTNLAIAGLAGKKVAGKQVVVKSNVNDLKGNNYTDANNIKPTEMPVSFTLDTNGSTVITLPPYSVSAFSLKIQP